LHPAPAAVVQPPGADLSMKRAKWLIEDFREYQK
jgi:hypothetical protein